MEHNEFSERLSRILETDPEDESVLHRIAVRWVDDVVVVTLHYPQGRNALSLATWQRVRDTLADLRTVPKLRAVIFNGSGTEAFAAGADIKEFPDKRLTAESAVQYNESIASALRAVGEVSVPVIASIQGLAVGGGCELAAACDIRISSSTARFGIPVGNLGVILGYTETSALVKLIGPGALKYLLFSGELVSAQFAREVGLVEEIVAPEELTSRVSKLTARIRQQSETTIRAAKVVTDMASRPLTDHDSELLTQLHIETYAGRDLREGVAAFQERRRPRFGGTI